MGSRYKLEAYDPIKQRRVHICTEMKLRYVIKYYLAAKRRGCKYFVLTWWIGR
jgi:hypothetical protein